jgi:hypothetical protein
MEILGTEEPADDNQDENSGDQIESIMESLTRIFRFL